jgi:hypothetical protein
MADGNQTVLIDRRRCISSALPCPAAPNSRIIIVRATTVCDSVHPYLIGGNRVDDKPAVGSPLDGLCNLNNALNVAWRQTRFIWANNFDLRAADKKHSDESDELAHRPNENKMSDGGRGRASLGVNGWKSSQNWGAQRSAVRSIAWLDEFTGFAFESSTRLVSCLRHRPGGQASRQKKASLRWNNDELQTPGQARRPPSLLSPLPGCCPTKR